MVIKILHNLKKLFRQDRKKVLIVLLLIIMVFSFTAAVILNLPKKVKGAWFNDNWAYRQTSVITNSGSAQSNYHLKLTVDTSTLVTASKMQSDCDDIRITDETGNLIKFWIEPTTCNTSSTIIWLKTPSVIVGTMNIYVYYGNPGASTGESPIKDVFIREIPNLNAMWKIDESSWTNNCSTDALVDSSGNSNVGDSCDNGLGPTTPVTGKFGNAVQLTGLISNQVGFYVNPSSGISDNTTFSVAFWVKTGNTSQTSSVMYNSYTGPLEIVQEDGSGGAGGKLSAIYGGVRSNSTYTFSETTTWHHVVVTRSSSDSTLRFYVDGATAGTSTSGTPSTAAAYGSIGMKYGGGNRSFVGYMDEVSVFNKQLSAEEVSDLYNYYGYATTNYGDTTLVMNRVGTSEPTVGSLASEESGPGPIGYWKLDEGADNTCSGGTNDICNSANNSTIDGASSGPTRQTEDLCLSGKCLYFDGTNDYIEIADNNALDFGSDGFTISSWIRTSNTASQYILEKDTSGCSNASWLLSTGTGTSGAAYGIVGSTSSTCGSESIDGGTTSLADNKWHHLVLVRNSGGTNYIYVDGKIYDSIADPGGSTTNSQKLTIGAHNNDSDTRSGYFKGFMDEIKIYNYSRTDAQIKADYASRGSSEGSSSVLGANAQNSPSSLSDGLEGYWKMDESSGNRSDSSGNANTLTDNATVAAANGKFNYASDFESGNSEYLSVSDNTTLSTGDIDFTISGWFKLESKSSSGTGVNKWGSAGNREFIAPYYDSGSDRFVFFVYPDGTNSTSVAANELGSPSTATWYFIVMWHDSTKDTINIQVNNGPVNTTANTGGVTDTTSPFHIGQIGTSGDFWDGLIDDVRFYKRVLNNQERSFLYNWAPGPVAYWKMDDASTSTSKIDSSGNGYTLSTAVGTVGTQPGKFGNAAYFPNAAGDYINVTDNANLSMGNVDFTVTGWFKINSLGDHRVMVFKGSASDTAGTEYKMHYNVTNNDFEFLISNGTTATTATTDGLLTPAADTWYFFAGGYDSVNDVVFLSINNSVRDTTTNTTGSQDTAGEFDVGAANGGSHHGGYIDDLKVYRYVRTTKQLTEDMNTGHPMGGSPIASQISYWNFDEQQGQTTNDKGFGDNDGTLGANSSASTDDPTWKMANTSSCKVNGCLSFDGGDYITIGDVDELETHLNEGFTISTWAKSSDWVDAGPEMLVAKYAGDADGDFYLGVYQNKARALINGLNGGVTGKVTNSTTNLTNGAWTHLVMTWSGGATDPILLYVNGQLDMTIESNNTLASITDSAEPIFIGVRTNSAKSAYFNGQIDETKIYNSALTASEILIDYNAGAAINLGGVLGTQDSEGFGGNAPVGYWSMNENTDNSCAGGANDVCDLTGGAIDGAKSNFPTASWVPGKVGSGLLYDASDDVVSLGTSNTLNLTSNLTIEAWIYPNSSGEGGNGRILDRDSGASTGYGFAVGGSASSQPQLVFTGFGVANVDSNNNVITYGAWNHVVVTRSSTTVTFYVNGIQQGSGTLASINSAAGATARLGNNSAGTRTFDGIMDEVKVFDYARSQAQVAYDYNRGAPLALYKLDECQGTTAYNSAPAGSGLAAGNNGTITPGAGGNTSAGTCDSGTSTEMWNDGTTGKRNASLGFDGTDDYITIADAAEFDVTNITASAWVYPTSVSSFQSVISRDSGTSGDRYWAIQISDAGLPYAYVCMADNSCTDTSGTARPTLSINTWYLLTMTYEGSTLKLYVNGNQVDSTADTDTMETGAEPIEIGRKGNASAYFTGQIDEASVYNYALSANQIKKVYNSGAIFFGPTTGNP